MYVFVSAGRVSRVALLQLAAASPLAAIHLPYGKRASLGSVLCFSARRYTEARRRAIDDVPLNQWSQLL